jgi:hypothetical protein
VEKLGEVPPFCTLSVFELSNSVSGCPVHRYVPLPGIPGEMNDGELPAANPTEPTASANLRRG